MGLALEPSFKRVELRPQLADLADLDLTAHTVRGPMRLRAVGKPGEREVTLEVPAACTAEVVLHRDELLALARTGRAAPAGHVRYNLPAGRAVTLRLRYA